MLPIIWSIIRKGPAFLILEWLAKDVFSDLWVENRNKLGIIGMQQSGKTRFLSYLRKIPFVEKSTGKERYPEFPYTTQSGKRIMIEEGIDIGGGAHFRDEYKKIIDKSDVIFYFFDIEQYLNDIQYRRECNSRFAVMLEDITAGKNREAWKSCLKENKRLVLFATHKDKVNLNDGEIKTEFKKIIQNSWYKGLDDYVLPINTTDEKELKAVCNEIFK